MPPDSISPRDFGALESNVRHLQQQMDRVERSLASVAEQVAEMRDTLAKAKGGWIGVSTMVTAAGAIGAFIARIIPNP
jgi:prefoldin subunit 5